MMFGKLMERASRAAEQRAAARIGQVAERLRDELPGGIGVEAGEGGVRLVGRGLRRRFATEPALRWMQFR